MIGVSEYGEGIPPLSAAPNDVEAMQRVLADPYLGSFDEVKPLINPNETEMKTAILQLFDNRDKEDLLLLFFSGHGITDDDEHLYLTTRGTSKDYFRATAVPANFVHKESYYSRAKRQVIILDCCYSGAFASGWQAKSVGVDIKRELGGEGRVVLTSSTATQVSFQQEGATLSLYTQYLVEGIETGAADTDGNGDIYVHELHNYAKSKVQNVKPNMKPDIILDREGFNILLAKARKNAEAEYRQIVEKYAKNGEMSKACRLILQQKQQELGIANAVAAEIEREVLEPFRRQRLINLDLYREAFREAVEYRYPLAQSSRDELKELQDVYGLKDEEVAIIEKEIIAENEGEYRREEEVKQTPTTSIVSHPVPASPEIGKQQSATPKTSFTSINQADKLTSAKGVDYTKLRDLLAAEKWRKADEETARLMLMVAGRQKERYLNVEDIHYFPCEDLRAIDHLWVKYSNGCFGFSVQKRIYQSLGGTREYDKKIWEAFGDRVGWRKNGEWLYYNQLIFNTKAPVAHLPGWCGGWSFGSLVRWLWFWEVYGRVSGLGCWWLDTDGGVWLLSRQDL